VAAIEAVLHPTPKTPTTASWIYFVTINKAGVTKFTSSKSQFDIWSKEAVKNGV
jgi:cell division protein YceG involved in septum cleavage